MPSAPVSWPPRSRGLDLERSAQLGAGLATLVVETVGTQQYTFDPAAFIARLADAFGAAVSQ